MSWQEDLIEALTGRSLGRRFLFRPDHYRKGTGEREPADLAWFCRDTVVLMYMTAGRRGSSRDVEHNLGQAKGWMRAWQAGQPLTGRSDDEDFSVLHSDNLATIVLSISADPALERILDHPEEAALVGVDLCATVSERLVTRMAERGAGISDLVAMLIAWRQVGAQLPELPDLEYFEVVRSLAVEKAADLVGWRPGGKVSKDLDLATTYVRGFRAGSAEGSSSAASEVSAIFADFGFSEQFRLLFGIGHAAELVRAGAGLVDLRFEIERYRGTIRVVQDTSYLAGAEGPSPSDDFEFTLELQHGLALPSFRTVRTPSRAWQLLRGRGPGGPGPGSE